MVGAHVHQGTELREPKLSLQNLLDVTRRSLQAGSSLLVPTIRPAVAGHAFSVPSSDFTSASAS
jgi:hypothetical protein